MKTDAAATETMFNMVLSAASASHANEPGHDGDYIGDGGLLMCGVCHKRRQMVLDVPMIGERIVPVACLCDIARREAEEAERRANEERERIAKMRKIGITSGDYLEMTFANDKGYDPQTAALAARYVAKWQEVQENNIGLLFHGSPRGGKTYWAAAIANAWIDAGRSAMITTIPQLVTAMSKDFERDKADILHRVANVRLLVLDDVGFERSTQYMDEKAFEIIDARCRAKKPLIVTTNLAPEQIVNPQSMSESRIFGRIKEVCQPVFVSGEACRKAIAEEKGSMARNILGL